MLIQTDARYWIDRLQLTPHPEGGFFRQTYRADLSMPKSALPDGFSGDRSVSTAIYFLLDAGDFSAFHRIASDEMWHFYAGDPLSMYVIRGQDLIEEIKLGADFNSGERFQAVVAAGCWFAASLSQPQGFALVGCTVAPGFDFADFELASRSALTAAYPKHRDLIQRLTRET